MNTTPPMEEGMVPFERVAKFIRQLTHDVRNGLSAIDLEGAYIAELITDPEASEEVRKMRSMVSSTARMLRDISNNFQPMTVHPVPWQATTFVEDLQARLEKRFPEEAQAGAVNVNFRVGLETIDVDLDLLTGAVLEVFNNAYQFGEDGVRVTLSAFEESGQVVFEVREPKREFQSQVPPGSWGVAPLITTRSGGYGLGLFRVRKILDAHGGRFVTEFRDGVLITRMSVPVWRDSGHDVRE